MNNNFQDYVTGQAFVLALSKPQIEGLAWFAMTEKQKDACPYVPYAMTVDALLRKGLIERDGKLAVTPEGELVLQLCRRAGLLKVALKAAA